MNRRGFLTLGTAGIGLFAGCSEQSPVGTPVETERPTATPTTTAESSDETPAERSDTLVVAPSNPGTDEAPLGSVQAAVDRAKPGQTVYVKPGVYPEHVETKRAGEPGNPITITGPPDAVLRHRGVEGKKDWGLVIGHSHVHLTGLTLDGLRNPAAPDRRRSYGWMNVACLPGGIDRVVHPEDFEPGTYLRDVKITPHAVGNTRGMAIHPILTNELEVGEFRLHGPVGLDYLEFDQYGHVGEVVYLGVPSGGEMRVTHGELDRSHDVHVHHVDASAGHGHIELVDVKIGCHDVTIEYCTSVNARLPSDNDNAGVVHLGGRDVTFRWNRIESAAFNAVHVGNYGKYRASIPHPNAPEAGTDNEIYGNEFVGSGADAVIYTHETSEEEQTLVCGNRVTGGTEGTPGTQCPDSIPEGDGVGHTGGASPWA